MADTPKMLLLGDEPIAHDLLSSYLSAWFEVSGKPCGHAEALAIARAAEVDVVLIDADLTDVDPAEFVMGIVLVCAAPVVTISAVAGPGSAVATALFAAGARVVSHKPTGRLTLDLHGAFGEALVATSRQIAAA
jgi:chemotaxis response regulator CheB